MCNNLLNFFMLRISFPIVLIIMLIMASCSQFSSINVIEFDKNNIEVSKLNINSESLDYGPFLKNDSKTIFFVSNREGSKQNQNNKLSHDFWFSNIENLHNNQFGKPQHSDNYDNFMSIGINTMYDEGSIAFSSQGNEIFFTACGRHDELGACDIYYSKKDGENWSMPQNLTSINSSFWDAQPTLTSDGKTMYFVSTRPDNPKKKLLEVSDKNIDLWISNFNTSKNQWDDPVNLIDLNSPGKEMSPFIAIDNVTLIFASDYYQPNYGGLDLYVTRYDKVSGKWSKPENLGKSINTAGNEFLPSLSQDGRVMIYTSSEGRLDNSQLNLYFAKFPKPIVVNK